MKQKVVIKVFMNCQKCRSKALKIAVGISGVDSAALKGDDKNQIEVIGDGIDPTELTIQLRKKIGHAVLESVSEIKEEEKKIGHAVLESVSEIKEEENKGNENEDKMLVVWPTYHPHHDVCHVFRDPYYDHSCSIM